MSLQIAKKKKIIIIIIIPVKELDFLYSGAVILKISSSAVRSSI